MARRRTGKQRQKKARPAPSSLSTQYSLPPAAAVIRAVNTVQEQPDFVPGWARAGVPPPAQDELPPSVPGQLSDDAALIAARQLKRPTLSTIGPTGAPNARNPQTATTLGLGSSDAGPWFDQAGQPLYPSNDGGEQIAERPLADRPSRRERAAKLATPTAIKIKNKAEVIRYSKILIVALEDVLDYDLARHHNQPPPALRIDDDPVYLEEIRNLVAELKTLNAFLAQKSPRQNKRAAGVVGVVARHFDTFLKTYVKSMAYGTAALTIGVIYHFLEQAGVTPDITGSILSHLKLR